MPERRTLKRARKAKREGKAPTTQAGEFVREEMHHIREEIKVRATFIHPRTTRHANS